MEELIELHDLDEERTLFGNRDLWRKAVSQRFGVELVSRGGQIKVIGDEEKVPAAAALLKQGLDALRSGRDPRCLEEIFGEQGFGEQGFGEQGEDNGQGGGRGALARGIEPRSGGQRRYVQSLAKHDITIVCGPAGTGKTFLAVASAVAALRRGAYRRLVLARPAVEAGERLGFLPGDLQAKVNPYLRPLYDSLFALLDPKRVQRYMETDVIEIVPLAYMRGRTLDRAFIILDEAQNTTRQQMKMFLTRMGEGARMVVTGDVTQTDLPPGTESGLVHCRRVLQGVDGIGLIDLGKGDIVRHPLVQKIVDAYDRHEDGPAA